MKKFFSSKFGIALAIIIVVGGITYATTWGNKDWLIRKINDSAGSDAKVPDSTMLQSMKVSELRKILKSVS